MTDDELFMERRQLTKAKLLAKWRKTEPCPNLLEVMESLPPKHKGKTYGLDGIRIDGSPEFIWAVMSRLTDLIDGENQLTRLQLSMNNCSAAEGDFNKGNGGYVLYLRLHHRTALGSHVSAVFDKDLAGATEKYAQALT